MSNMWTQHLPITDGPWRIQDPNRGIIYDAQDRRIAVVPKAGAVPFDERQANLAAISVVPELIAALRQAAYALDQMGVPLKPEFYDLMNRATPGAAELVPQALRAAGIASICELDNYAHCVQPKGEPAPHTNPTDRGQALPATVHAQPEPQPKHVPDPPTAPSRDHDD